MNHPFEKQPLLLATGQGRSGTTVLTRALAEHSQIYSNRVESNVMKDVLLAGHGSSTVTSRVRQMVLDRDEHDRVFQRMLLHLLFPADRWTESRPPLAVSTFSAMNPAAASFATDVFPGMHFANIVRNGIEVVASRMVHRVLGQHSFEEHCHAWNAAREMAEWGEGRDDFSLIRHEQLLDPDSCARAFARVLERAGLPAEDACTNYVLSRKHNQTRYEAESESQKADLSARSARWQHWTDGQRQMFRDICSKSMDYFGYEMP